MERCVIRTPTDKAYPTPVGCVSRTVSMQGQGSIHADAIALNKERDSR